MTKDEVGILDSRLAAMGDAELDELKELLDIFVSEKTCAEREKNFLTAMENNTAAVESMTTAANTITEQANDHETRLSVIEADRKRKQRTLPVKLTIGGLVIAALAQADNVIAFIKKIAQ